MEGSIIATIITDHIKNNSQNSESLHGPPCGIQPCGIHMLGALSMRYISHAPCAVTYQAGRANAESPVRMMRRSWRGLTNSFVYPFMLGPSRNRYTRKFLCSSAAKSHKNSPWKAVWPT
jgi:hypothetical protein